VIEREPHKADCKRREEDHRSITVFRINRKEYSCKTQYLCFNAGKRGIYHVRIQGMRETLGLVKLKPFTNHSPSLF
jgi:hypothetical protein